MEQADEVGAGARESEACGGTTTTLGPEFCFGPGTGAEGGMSPGKGSWGAPGGMGWILPTTKQRPRLAYRMPAEWLPTPSDVLAV